MGIRKQLQKKVTAHIKDLEKRGIDVQRVTRGKSIEQIAWNKKTYDNFINQKKNVLTRERDIKKRTNKQGYVLSEKEYRTLKKLEKQMNNKKQLELKKVEKMFGNLSKIEKDFLQGKAIKHLNSKEEIQLQTSFRKENYIDSYNSNIDLKYFKDFVEDEIKDFSYLDVIDKRKEEFLNQIKDWAMNYRLGVVADSELKNHTKKMVEHFENLYDNMSFIQAVQFNQDLSHKLQMVESASDNQYSSYNEKRMLEELMKRQEQREFIISE